MSKLNLTEFAEKHMDLALHPAQERMVVTIMQGKKVVMHFPRLFGVNTAKLVAEKYKKYLDELPEAPAALSPQPRTRTKKATDAKSELTKGD